MPIHPIAIQLKYREMGRIRLGQKVPYGKDKTRPDKLETFRLTSPDRNLLDLAAGLFGGEVNPWESPRGQEYELITTTNEIPVVVPQQDFANAQSFELWGVPEGDKGVRRLRRCDGVNESLGDTKCLCDPGDRECKPVTHLLVKIPSLPDPLGVWRVTTRSFNAAAELPATVHTLATLMAFNVTVDAVLATTARSSISPDGKRRHYRVVEIRIPHTADEMIAALPQGVNQAEFVAALTAGPQVQAPAGRPVLPPTPVAAALPASPAPLSTPDDDSVDSGPASSEPASIADIVEIVATATVMPEEEPEPDKTLSVRERVHLEVATLRTREQKQGRLMELLAAVPDPDDRANTKPIWERYIRTLFRLMEQLGYWKRDPLHAVLRQQPYGVEHLSALNKGDLVKLGRSAAASAHQTIDGTASDG